jgi:RNA polymerase sigma factor (sigma-70 family)
VRPNSYVTDVSMQPRPPGDRLDLSGPGGLRAITRLYDEHARPLHRYLARRLDPATADDLVAETFLTAWRSRDRYDPERASGRAWLYGIATNLLREHTRSEVRGLRAHARHGGRAASGDDVGTVAVSRADARVEVRRLAAAIAELRPDDRDVLLLVAWGGLEPAEVAQALRLPQGTVRHRLHRARAALRGTADPEGGQP